MTGPDTTTTRACTRVVAHLLTIATTVAASISGDDLGHEDASGGTP